MQDLPKVALFRAREDAAQSAVRLIEAGLAAVLLPVIETRPLPLALTRPRYDAVVATSAKAFLAGAPVDRAAPFYCVGEQTARAAEGAGWRLAAPASCDAEALARVVRECVSPGASVLYLAGRDRKTALEDALGGFYALEVADAYAAEARDGFSPADVEALASCRAALHYSRRSAELAAALATRAGAGEVFARLAHVALSPDVAEPLEAMGLSVCAAHEANEAALLAALGAVLQHVSFGGGLSYSRPIIESADGMAEDDRETHAPELAGIPARHDGVPDPVVIDGEAARIGEPEPEAAIADAPEPIFEPAAPDSPPPPFRPEPRPSRGPSRFGSFVAGAIGGLIVAVLATAGLYSWLAPRADLVEAEASRIAALESSAERESSTLGSLEKRLAGLETAQKTSPATLGAINDKVTALADRLEKVEQAPGASASGPDSSALSGRVDKLEQALTAPKTETRAAPEFGAGEKSAEVAIVAEAIRDRLAAGAPFPGELAALASLGVDPAKLAPLKAMADGGPSGSVLSAAFSELAPSVLAAAAKHESGSIGDRFLDHLRGLVVVHDLSEKAGDDPDALVTQVEALSRRGDIAGALAAFAKLPEPARTVAAAWSAEAGRAAAAAAALRSLREDAIARLTAGKGQ